MNWYVLYTAPRAELQVEQRLRSLGVETYLPLQKKARQWSDRVKLLEVPLFTSYVFVYTSDEVLRTLPVVDGVCRIVFFNQTPAQVSQCEIDALKTFCEQASLFHCSLLTNDEVAVVCGPLKNTRGRVVRSVRNKLILKIEQLGVYLCLDKNQVIKKH